MAISFGFIGAGNMGGALAKAVAKAQPAGGLFLADKNQQVAQALAAELKCNAVEVAEAAGCSYVVLGVKPQVLPQLLEELAPVLAARQDRFVLISMAAGVTMAQIQQMAGKDYPVIRIMPNTPASVGGGMILYDATASVTEKELVFFTHHFRFAGVLDPLPENLIDAGSAVSGCGPAFACLFMEALADGGVACGLPRQKAMEYAQQMLLGTAMLAQKTGQHPGQLKDAVCSPGGSTIAGVKALEDGAFRASVMQAVQAAFVRTQELGK